ncbi:MAG: glycosyltransferase [Patescibacteria group bacterium]
MNNKVVITGGHPTPAEAVIEEITKEGDWQIFYFGRRHAQEGQKDLSFEHQQITKMENVTFVHINTGRLQRRLTRRTIPSLMKVPPGLTVSFAQLLKIKPKLIIGFGGYLSTPVILAGYLLGIPSISHEQTRTLGLGNRLNWPWIKKLAVSFPELVKSNKTVLTGNPISQSAFNPQVPSDWPIKIFVEKSKKPILFVTGGGTGSQIINQVVGLALPELRKQFTIVHQTGTNLFSAHQTDDYLPVDFIDSRYFGWLMQHSTLMISRSGANTVWKMASLKIPGILIPLPKTAGNEAIKNALFLESLGLGKIVHQEKLSTESLLSAIEQFKPQFGQYPDWWSKTNPTKAAKKVWQLAKEQIK